MVIDEEAFLGMVRAALADGGPIARRMQSFQQNPLQIDYAERFARLLLDKKTPASGEAPPVALLEAGTGTGKTFGYLVPAVLWSALTGKRVAIASYTLDLVHRLRDESSFVVEALAELIPAEAQHGLTIGVRCGISEFASPSRIREVAASVASLTDEQRHTLDALHLHASSGPGLFADFPYALPAQVGRSDLCLVPTSSAKDRGAYDMHVAKSLQARILVCTHAALLLFATGRGNALAEDAREHQPSALIVDEADRLPAMAESISSNYTSVNELRRLLSDAGVGRQNKAWELVESLDSCIHGLVQPGDTCLVSDAEIADVRPQLSDLVVALQRKLGRIYRDVSKKRGLHELSYRLRGATFALASVARSFACRSKSRVGFLQVSPVRGFASLGVRLDNPGVALSYAWRIPPSASREQRITLEKLLLTSATLSSGRADSLSRFLPYVGIRSDSQSVRHDLSASLEPRAFGQLDIVFADGAAPRPHEMDADGDIVKSRAWLAYASAMILEAASAGGRTLVLVPSYSDVGALAEQLEGTLGRRLLAQTRDLGQQMECRTAFMRQFHAVWITPSCWEGLDLPGLIKHLVIARIPFKPQNAPAMLAKQEILVALGRSREHALQACVAMARADASRKLRQGIGRSIRSASDSATLWIADSRFGLPAAVSEAALDDGLELVCPLNHFLHTIPKRFLSRVESSPERARVFLSEKHTLWTLRRPASV